MDRIRVARSMLIAGLAFVFAGFGIWKFAQPFYWIGWIPPWMEGALSLDRNGWLAIIGAVEIAFALLLLVPVRTVRQISCSLMVLHLIAVITQTGWNDVGVRDGGLLLASVALLMLL